MILGTFAYWFIYKVIKLQSYNYKVLILFLKKKIKVICKRAIFAQNASTVF